MTSTLPRVAAILVMLAMWIGSIVDAARRAKAGWVVAIVLFWPVLAGYWVVRVFRLGRS